MNYDPELSSSDIVAWLSILRRLVGRGSVADGRTEASILSRLSLLSLRRLSSLTGNSMAVVSLSMLASGSYHSVLHQSCVPITFDPLTKLMGWLFSVAIWNCCWAGFDKTSLVCGTY